MIKNVVNKIRKRTGEVEEFNDSKIIAAIEKAMHVVDEHDSKEAKKLTSMIVDEINKRAGGFNQGIPNVEQVQDIVEEVLSKSKFQRTAKAYMLYRRGRTHARELKAFFGIKDDLKFDVNAIRVLQERYLLKDEKGRIIETPTEMFQRVAKAIASVEKKDREKWEKRFFEMMRNLEFLPNSPTLMNAGTSLGQLSACFVLPIEDSLESIFDTLKKTALIQQSGGGTGFSFSHLRPKGDIVRSTKGSASGPVSFIEIYDAATEVIKQGGKRRGANMGILDVYHPDIVDFIISKQKEKHLSNFNISVSVDDKFMQAVEKNEDYELINPHNGKVARKVNARALFDLICESAWKTGDPGMIFIDEINRKNQVPGVGRIEATNPCIAKGVLVATNEGLVPIEGVHNSHYVSTTEGINPVKWAGKTGYKEVFNVKTKAGFEIRATADHLILTKAGWKRVEDLDEKDILVLGKIPFGKLKMQKEEALALGWLIGDGHLTKDLNRVIFYFNKKDKNEMIGLIKDYLDRLNENPVELSGKGSETRLTYGSKVAKFFIKRGVAYRKARDKEVPSVIFGADKESVKNFISALFGADGSVQGSREKGISIRLASSSLKLLKQVQLLLLQFNILSKVHEERRKAGNRILPNSDRNPKKYHRNEDHELIISRESAFKFMKDIGFSVNAKNKKFQRIKPLKRYRDNIDLSVKEIIKIGKEKVYDINEPVTHSFVANGLVVHNCGEVPLLNYESCNLGSINLTKFVSNGKIDYEKLKISVRDAVRFLDNVIDANKYPFIELKRMALGNRRIGLGVMGFAEMLMLLDIPYDSEKAVEVAEKLMSFITKEAHAASEALGKEKGNFPNFKKSIWDGKVSYMRNCACTTIAPTGTLSIIAGCSSGIEPLFALSYMREVLSGKHLFETNKIFLSRILKENLYSEELIKEIAKQGNLANINLPERIKRLFKTALEIDPNQHIKIQAAFQKYTDNAVSKTINLRNDASVEDVKKAYMLAYKLKCKGITIYRYGSKPEQVLYLGKGKEYSKASSEYAYGTCIGKVCAL